MSTGLSVAPDVAVRLRNQPVQARSSARVESLLDATAGIVDEIGYERLTTALVAERAGASIGTLYRYYPDRLAVLYALRSRLLARFTERLDEVLQFGEQKDLDAWLSVGIRLYAEMYLTEPGFRAIRFGDIVDEKVQGFAGAGNGVIAGYLVDRYAEHYPVEDRDQLLFHLEVMVEIGEALVNRSYSTPEDEPDERFINCFEEISRSYLRQHIPDL